MQIKLDSIEIREVLHFLGWRGAPIEKPLLEQLEVLVQRALEQINPRAVLMRFDLEESGALAGTSFVPQGEDVRQMLGPCCAVYLFAATLGAESERLLLKEQARSGAQAVLMDAVLSAAIEAVCDHAENDLRKKLEREGLYLTDRFSPGYGDMPIEQTKEICEVLSVQRSAGLTVSSSGIMIPRKSVTAVMGVSRVPVYRRPSGCAGCHARETCAMARKQ